MTYKLFFRQCTHQLQGIYSPSESEAIMRILFIHMLQCTSAQLMLYWDKHFDDDFADRANPLLQRLLLHEPVQYVTGETTFCDCKIMVNPHVLIPRPETEELVQWICETIEVNKPHKIVDICTGSGCIAIALKKYFATSHIYGTDISPPAIAMAQKNAALNGVEINFLANDIMADDEKTFLNQADVVVSNPPYVSVSDKKNMSPNVLLYEPHSALFTGVEDDTVFYERIAALLQTNMSSGAILFFEINEAHANRINSILEKNNFSQIEIKKDMFGKNRFAKAVKQKR